MIQHSTTCLRWQNRINTKFSTRSDEYNSRIKALFTTLLVFTMPAWAANDIAQITLGKALFSKAAVPACAICHTLKDAGSVGTIGPALDELRPESARVLQALRNGIGQMPAYSGQLSDQEMAAIAAYVAKASGAAKP